MTLISRQADELIKFSQHRQISLTRIDKPLGIVVDRFDDENAVMVASLLPGSVADLSEQVFVSRIMNIYIYIYIYNVSPDSRCVLKYWIPQRLFYIRVKSRLISLALNFRSRKHKDA